MPPIPKGPVAAKPEGITAATTQRDEPRDGRTLPVASPATITAHSSSVTPLMPAPGAAAMPVPTDATSMTSPAPTTTSSSARSDGPAPPQPGAVPIAPVQTASLDPPPAATSYASGPPAQAGLPPPTGTALQGRSTSTTTAASITGPGPTTLNFGPVGASRSRSEYGRPEGYVQNPFAADMSPQQRATGELEARNQGASGSILPAPIADSLGGLTGRSTDTDNKGVWETVKGMASAAGNKVAQAEAEVWNRINKK